MPTYTETTTEAGKSITEWTTYLERGLISLDTYVAMIRGVSSVLATSKPCPSCDELVRDESDAEGFCSIACRFVDDYAAGRTLDAIAATGSIRTEK